MILVRRLAREHSLWAALISVVIAYAMGAGFTIDKNIIDGFQEPWSALGLFIWLFLVILWSASSVVHHAEVLAHKYGEPYGTLILTLSVVTIEVIMIVAIMLHEENNPTFARDTLYTLLIRHFPANLQIHGNRIYIAPPRELHSLRSPPMTRLWRADHVRKAIWQRFPPSRHTSPVFSTLPSISSAYAGTGLRRRSSIKAKIFWNKIFDTATSASWNVT